MASSWYKDFQNNLAAVGTRSQAGTGSLARMPVSTVDTSNWDKPLNGFGDHLLDFGGRVLDVLSRPGYAVGSFLNTGLRNDVNGTHVNPFEMAWKGLIGENKEFFQPVSILDPYQEGENGIETAGRWLGDFAASILTDPTTYIGAGAVSKVGKLTGLSKVGEGIKDAAQTTNAGRMVSASDLAASDLATDTSRLRDSLDSIKVAPGDSMIKSILGAAKSNVEVPQMGVKNTLIDNMPVMSVNDTANKSGRDLIDSLLAEPNLKMGVVGDLSNPAAQQGVEKIAKNLKYRTGNPEADLAMFTILRSDIAQNLRKIRGRLYSKGEFDSPWEDRLVTDAIKRPDKMEFPAIPKPQAKEVAGPEIPGRPVAEQANRDAALRFYWESSKDVNSAAAAKKVKGDVYAIHGDNVYYDGKLVGKDGFQSFKAHVDETTDFTDIGGINQAELSIPLGNGHMTAGQYASALKQGAEKPFLADSSLPVGEDIMGLNDYIKSRSATYAERAKSRPGEVTRTEPTAEEIAAYEKAVADQNAAKAAYEAQVKAADESMPTWETVRPDAQSRREWINKHRDKLTDKDRKRLNEALYRGSQKQFDKIIDDIVERETALDLNAVHDLAQAVKDGRVSKEEANNFYALFNAKNATGAEAKIKSIDKSLASLREKLSDKIRETGPHGADNPSLARPEALRAAEAQPIPIAKTPMKFFDREYKIKRETFDSSEMRQFVEAVKDVVDPETLGKIKPSQAELLHKSIRAALSDKYLHNRANLPKVTNRMRTNNDLKTYNTFREFNEHKQYSFWKNLIGDISKQMPKELRGGERAAHVYDEAMPVLKAYDQLLRTYGIHPSIEAGGKGLPLSLHDVLSSLPRAQAEKFFFNKAAEITPQQWLHIAEEAFYSKIDDVKDIATIMLRQSSEDLSFAGNAKWVGEQAGKNTAKRQAKKGQVGENFNKEQIFRAAAVQGKTFEKNINDIITPEFARQIKDLVTYNSRRAEIQAGQFVRATSDAKIQKFVDDMAQVRTQQELFSLVENASKGIAGFTKDTNMIPPPGAANAVKDQVDLVTRSNPGTEIAIREQSALKAANSVEDTKTAGQNATKAVDERLDDMIPEFDFSKNPEYRAFGVAMHHLAPHMQEGMLRHVMLSGQNIAMEYSKNFSRALSDFEKSVGYDRAKAIWSDIQKGIDGPESLAAEYNKMHQIISETFDVLRRSGVDPQHLNSNLGKYKLNRERFALKGKNWEEAYDSWKEWGDLEDPLNVLSRFYAAAQKSRVEKEMFDRFSLDFGSKTPKPGYGRITASNGKSRVAHLIDTRMYYPEEVIRNLHSLDQTIRELAKPSSNNKILRIFDESTHRLKSGLTIYRPGHHMRNAYGDAWLNFMDGVWNPSHYKKAWGVMATRADHYDPQLLQHIDLESFRPNGKIVSSVTVNGKRVDIDENMAYLLMRDSGNLPTYASLEDLGAASTYGQPSKINEGKVSLNAPTGGRAHKVATTVSEVRDHYFRAAHFIKLLEDTKSLKVVPRAGESAEATTRRALLEKSYEITARVRKYHPDGSDLQRFERNGLKRGILFYSWIRKMIPLVIETTVMNPGRTLAFPKATYNMAQAQGIDLNGLGDPFPADQLFPAWMGGTQGPVGGSSTYGYIGMRPGNPLMDIFDQYLDSPGGAYQTIIGATHPLIKMPYELATGATTQGVPINDLGKYALGQVPFGSLVNTLVGKPVGGTSESDAGYDPGGIRDPKAMALINTLTGLGLIDMSKPSYVKTGEFDVKYGRTEGP